MIVLLKNSVVEIIVKGVVQADNQTGWAIVGGSSDGKSWTPPSGYDVREAPSEVTIGWFFDGESWHAPGLSFDEAIAQIDEHVGNLLASGVVVSGVRFSLSTDDRLDWLGLLVLRETLLANAGGSIPLMGIDGQILNLTSAAQIETVAGTLASYRLFIQALSVGARTQVNQAANGQERAAIVNQFKSIT